MITNNSYAVTNYYVDYANGTDGGGGEDCTDAGANECKTIKFAADTIGTVDAGGSQINVEYDDASMTQTLTSDLTINTAGGSDTSPLIIRGYSSSINDGTMAVIDGDNAAAIAMDISVPFVILADLEIKNATGDCVFSDSSGDNGYMVNVYAHTCGDDGIEVENNNYYLKIFGVEIANTTDDGHVSGDVNDIRFSYIHDTTGKGIYGSQNYMDISNNIIDTTGDDGINVYEGVTVIGNTVYNSTGDNLEILSSKQSLVAINNILNKASAYNLNADGNAFIAGYNSVWDNGGTAQTGTIFMSLSNDLTTNPSLNTTTFQASGGDDLGFPLYFDSPSGGSTVVSHIDIGATSYEETAGGGGGGATGFLLAF